MAASQKIGSFRPITFLHSGKPVRPYRPQRPNREPGRKGISLSGDSSVKEFQQVLLRNSKMTPQELGASAVRLQKSLGISVNITI